MLSIYEAHEEHPVKCQLMQPIYSGDGNAKKVIDWQPSEIFCWCKESGFQTTQTTEQNRRYKQTKGTLETISLKKDEISLDWKIRFENEDYIITEITQEDDKQQQVLLSGGAIVKTTLQVRR